MKIGQFPAPDALIIGAQKAGTTALWGALSRHSMVGKSKKKEARFFLSDRDEGFEFYKEIFVEPDKFNIDATRPSI